MFCHGFCHPEQKPVTKQPSRISLTVGVAHGYYDLSLSGLLCLNIIVEKQSHIYA